MNSFLSPLPAGMNEQKNISCFKKIMNWLGIKPRSFSNTRKNYSK
jgi:hypothetical protein